MKKVTKNNKITLSRLSKTLKNTHVVSYPKTGSTLIRFFFDGIYEQLNAYIPFKKLEQFNPYLHKKIFQGWEKFHINSPYRVRYFFKNPLLHYIKYHHLDIYNIGSKIKENDIIIFLIRDPRSVVTSNYFNRFRGELTISEYIRDEKNGIKKVIDFYNNWYLKVNDYKKFIIIKYEDIINCKKDEIKAGLIQLIPNFEAEFEFIDKSIGKIKLLKTDHPNPINFREYVDFIINDTFTISDFYNGSDKEYMQKQLKNLNSEFGYE